MSLVAVFLYSTVIVVAAPLYNPGDTLDPTCLPSSTDCTVDIDRWSDYTTIPADGLTNQVLTTDGAGVLSWSTPAVSPISVANTTTLYSSGLSGTGTGSITGYNFIVGVDAGTTTTNVEQSNFIGRLAGYTSTDASNSNFFGYSAGYGAPNASNSNFIGNSAGYTAQNASNSNFIGNGAGSGSVDAGYSNFFGNQAGKSAQNANNSNFFGYITGYGEIDANNLNFFGTIA